MTISNAEELIALTDDPARFASAAVFEEWVRERWRAFSEAGPLSVVPASIQHAEGDWFGNHRGIYVLIYPDSFSDLIEFDLFNGFASSIQQPLVWGEEDLMNWFSEEHEDEIAEGFVEQWQNAEILDHDAMMTQIEEWKVADEAKSALRDLRIEAGCGYADEDSGSLVAKTDQGYLSFFVVEDC